MPDLSDGQAAHYKCSLTNPVKERVLAITSIKTLPLATTSSLTATIIHFYLPDQRLNPPLTG